MKKRDVIIVGGGASGICCAINLKRANKNLSVTVLEQKEKIKDIKAHIETSFNNIHTEIKQFTIQIENKIISDTIYNYFEKCLENAILIYRKIITENIKKTS